MSVKNVHLIIVYFAIEKHETTSNYIVSNYRLIVCMHAAIHLQYELEIIIIWEQAYISILRSREDNLYVYSNQWKHDNHRKVHLAILTARKIELTKLCRFRLDLQVGKRSSVAEKRFVAAPNRQKLRIVRTGALDCAHENRQRILRRAS